MSDAPGGPDWERSNDGKWYLPGVLSGAGWIRGAGSIWYPPPTPKPPRDPATTGGGKGLERWLRKYWWALAIGVVALVAFGAIGSATAPEDEDERVAAVETTSTTEEPTTTRTEAPTTTSTTAAPTTTTTDEANAGLRTECSDGRADVVSQTSDLNHPRDPVVEVATGEPGFVDIVSTSIRRTGDDLVLRFDLAAALPSSMPEEHDSIFYYALVGPADDPLNHGYQLGIELLPEGWDVSTTRMFEDFERVNLGGDPAVDGPVLSARFPVDSFDDLGDDDLAWTAGSETTIYFGPDELVSSLLQDACGTTEGLVSDGDDFQRIGP